MNGSFFPTESKFRDSPLCKTADSSSVETLVRRAFDQLVNVSWDENRSRTASLATFGNYEIRLVEIFSADADNRPYLWVELYSRELRIIVDSCGCGDLEAAVLAAEYLMSQVRHYEEGAGGDEGHPDSGA
jgi:hypothetical protein